MICVSQLQPSAVDQVTKKRVIKMFRLTVFLACLALCRTHAVLPLVVPAVHAIHTPLAVPYPLYHGYGHGYLGHSLIAKPLAHHIFKRSPHLVAPLAHVVAPIAPVAVSHHSRVDVHHSPVVAPVVPVVKPVLAPFVPAAPLLHKSVLAAPLPYALGHYGGLYPHLAHSNY